MIALDATTQPGTVDVTAEKSRDLEISSQAARPAEGSTTIPRGSRAKRPEARGSDMKQHRLAKRFSHKVDRSGSCHEWKGSIARNGYGCIHHDGRTAYAHRIAWLLRYGDVPDGCLVLHRCDNRRCVNTDHLFLGSFKDNMADMVAKRRQAHGERNAHAKLTERQVIEIRTMGGSNRSVAEQYGVSPGLVSMIRSRRIWRMVGMI